MLSYSMRRKSLTRRSGNEKSVVSTTSSGAHTVYFIRSYARPIESIETKTHTMTKSRPSEQNGSE
jgi:hypothetical protein